MPRLKEKYENEVVPLLREELGATNPFTVPRLKKVVVNMGFGGADRDQIKAHTECLGAITGQRAMVTRASKSISNFKLREGMPVGAKVTLRGDRMYEFLDRLISAALPRIRDFRGVSARAFDGKGNYTLGIREQTIFPEIDPNKVSESQGMDISIVTTAREDEAARLLLKHLGMPFGEN
jgi:large subunit ribosomal protein L5